MTHKFKMSKLTLAATAAVLAALLWAPAAQAILVGNGPGVGASSDFYLFPAPVFDVNGVPSGLYFGVDNVSFDPLAGPWEKTFHLALNPEQQQPFPIVEGGNFSTFFILEFLLVDGDTPWTDWHETILTPGWEWWDFDPELYESVDSGTGIYGLDVETLIPGLTYNMTATTVGFFFDPLAPGTAIAILKGIQWVGVDANNLEEVTAGPFQVSEYPTVPEPSTFILLGAGLAGLALWRKKRV